MKKENTNREQLTIIKKGWVVKKLGEVCKTGAGGTPLKSHKDYYENGNIPWLRSGEVCQRDIVECELFITEKGLNNSSAKLFPKNTVLVAMYGATAGQVGILRFECSTNQAVCGILPNEKFVPEFLYYKFLAGKEVLVKQAVGGAQPNISQIKIKNTLIPVIPLTQQKQIVKILDQAFTAIELAKNNAQQNLLNAKQLFESYLQNVFVNGKLKVESGEWVEKSLGEIANVTYGFTDKSTEEGDYRYVRITDIDKNGELIPTGKKYINSSKDGKDFILKENDILMARTGATFAKLLLYKDIEPSIYASYLIKIDFTEDIDNEFYWFFSKTNSYWEQANALSTGAAQPHFNGKALKQVVFSYPKSLKEQKKLIKEFRKLQAQTKKLESIYEQKIIDLEELKKSILQKAFSGALTN